ncbi:MAG: hypothetical protein MR992_02945 [Lachnospiraceae bacterium]|nr:hypothetical protein [Lachnospiraceae bacterium]MDD7628660.1 hypothetical protein [Lachnospiraceae bacterium]MDY4120186.1 hypothetical protein [Lachnospiraceae bacterium]
MKLKDTYITHDSDGEQILLDTSSSFAGLIRSNFSIFLYRVVFCLFS